MKVRGIQGVSIAVIDGGKIVKATGYGIADVASGRPIDESTLFQAASLSKPVTALGALILVEKGALALDEDVNVRLASWKLPASPLSVTEKVTLRRLLSHTAGTTVHGFGGYAIGAPLPDLVQILNGAKPANSPAVRVTKTPGAESIYSGGGYTIVQQLMVDASASSFSALMKALVLDPLGMIHSSFLQPLAPRSAARAATGHGTWGRAVAGRWHVYPELAAAGLWTTPSDLACFVIGIQRALAGQPDTVVSQSTARLMITEVKDGYGLGLGVGGKPGSGDTLFAHEGRNEGFDSLFADLASAGKGAVIMIDRNDNSGAMMEVLRAIAKEYDWNTVAK
jgi:CubicO group peptidase (beta-lactamase class C family)